MALAQTATLWKPITTAFEWVHQVATILDNDTQLDGQNVRYNLERVLRAMEHCKGQAASLAPGIDHFVKVTRTYAPGLFHCYDVEGLPRTNNDLEQLFGRSATSPTSMHRRQSCPSFPSGARFSPDCGSDCHSTAFVYFWRFGDGFDCSLAIRSSGSQSSSTQAQSTTAFSPLPCFILG
jgi:hypothetical protein